MEMPKPSAGHLKLEAFAGTWEGREKLFPSPWDPAGGEATGRMRARVALDGFAVIVDYEQERGGEVNFRGHGVFTFDAKEEIYTLTWFDCMGSPPEVFRGRFTGEVLELAHGGPGMHARLTYDLSEAGRLSKRMELSEDGSAWDRFLEGELMQLFL